MCIIVVPCSVVCRQLGYADGEARCGAYYTPGDVSWPIHLGELKCTGQESSILDCRRGRTVTCLHHDDASVFCLREGIN